MRRRIIVGQLDVSILQEKVLSPILGIGDPRTDQRIRFVGGSHKLSELAQIADSTGGVAFAMFPTAMEDLMQIADESKLMRRSQPGLNRNFEADCLFINFHNQ